MNIGELEIECQRMRTRTDHRHLAAQHVDELRQLIEVRPAQEAPEACHARIGTARLTRRRSERRIAQIGVHGSELQELEGPCSMAEPDLAVDDGPRRLELEQKRDHEQQGREGEECCRRDDRIERQLEGGAGTIGRERRCQLGTAREQLIDRRLGGAIAHRTSGRPGSASPP